MLLLVVACKRYKNLCVYVSMYSEYDKYTQKWKCFIVHFNNKAYS